MIAPDVHAAALRYEALGLRIIEVHVPVGAACSCGNTACGSPGKHPKRSSWTQAPASAAAFANGVPHNIGILTGAPSGIVVIDVDAGGEETLAKLEREHGPLPPTVQARTGTGRRHIYFKHPGMPVKNDVKRRLGPGLDVRGDGGFVVAPPSLHANGKRYEWMPGAAPWDRELATLPSWLLGKLSEPQRMAPLQRHGGPANDASARRYA